MAKSGNGNWMTDRWSGSNRGIAEFKDFIQNRLLSILGIKNQNLIDEESSQTERIIQRKNEKSGAYEVSFSVHGHSLKIDAVAHELPKDTINVGISVVNAFLDVSCYSVATGKVQHRYPDVTVYQKVLDAAIQNGICSWCAGSNSTKFYELIRVLETWAVKTYEGKKVSFGFVFDPDKESDFRTDDRGKFGNGTWISFLDDDYAATLSDGIHSIIELDKNCNFSQFLSLTNKGRVEGYELNHGTPYRFSHVIQSYVTGSRVGVFLLNNGDIVLSKNQAVQFIKRNLKWLNISSDAFYGVILAKMSNEPAPEFPVLLKAVYASVLDVSFSHSGGIIAVVEKKGLLTDYTTEETTGGDAGKTRKKIKSQPIINPCDDLMFHYNDEMIKKHMKELQPGLEDDEIKKRFLKRYVVKALIKDQGFVDLDRKLRAELIAMDGACILDYNGNICSVGAIIQNDSGSSGGGRTSAAKKLSKYGFAVKVSTDGYIEVFVNEQNIYSVK